MTAQERLLAPAKLNVYLRVLGRRPDGYHLLDSLMVPISLYDELLVTVGPPSRDGIPEVHVKSDSDAAPGGSGNLAHRAAALLLTRLGRAAMVWIDLYKRIPVGSGLGGGSSDAAAVLLALNRLLGSPLSRPALAQLGAEIGADVAFFVHGGPARVRGVGEQISPMEVLESLPLVVCWDRYALSTKEVYSHVRLSLTSPPAVSNMPNFVSGCKLDPELFVNDLEAAAAEIHPETLALKSRLTEEGAIGSLMTGSGAAVFGMWPDGTSAYGAAVRLRRDGLWAEPVGVLAASPATAP